MDLTPLEAAEKEKSELEAAQRELKTDIRKKKRQGAAAKKAWQVTGSLLHTVLIIYILAQYAKGPAGRFLITAARKRRWPEKPKDEVARIVENLWYQTALEDLEALCNADSPSDEPAFRVATAVVNEWNLVVWATKLNIKPGIAPSTELLLQRYEKNVADLPERFQPRPLSGSGARSSHEARDRMFAKRFRARWDAKIGTIRVCEDIPVPVMKDKAIPNSHTLRNQIRYIN
jgi:hypothetical protein